MGKKPSPGPWEVDSINNEGEYGNDGPDTRSGFKSWMVIDANGRAIFDTMNSDTAEVVEEYDEEGGCAFDEVGLANATLAAAAHDLLDALQYALPYLRAAVPNPRNGVNADCTDDVNCVDRALAAIAKATGA